MPYSYIISMTIEGKPYSFSTDSTVNFSDNDDSLEEVLKQHVFLFFGNEMGLKRMFTGFNREVFANSVTVANPENNNIVYGLKKSLLLYSPNKDD